MVILQNESQIIEARRAFGILFVTVAMAVAIGTILTEIAFLRNTPLYYYAIIWLGSFSITFGAAFPKIRKSIRSIQGRMKNSMKWPTNAKAINGICWAGPFAIIPLFPHFYQFLVLLGIGSGNFSSSNPYCTGSRHDSLYIKARCCNNDLSDFNINCIRCSWDICTFLRMSI